MSVQSISASTTNRVLLVDLENIPSLANDLLAMLEQYAQVVICYAQSTAKIPFDSLAPLASALSTCRLKIIKMPAAGKNAADFGIAFLAGTLCHQCATDTSFVILSNDAGLDHVISMLVAQGRSAVRIAYLQDAATPGQFGSTRHKAALYCAHLANPRHSRPARLPALKNSIAATLNLSSEQQTGDVLLELERTGAIRLNRLIVTYDMATVSHLCLWADEAIAKAG